MKVLVMLLQYSDGPAPDWTPDFIAPLYNAPYPGGNNWTGSIADYYSAVSWGQMAVQADVVGPYTLDIPSTDKLLCWNLSQISARADAKAVAAGVNLALYTNRAYWMQANPNCPSTLNTADDPGSRTWYNFDSAICGVGHPSACSSFIRTIAHELGHNLGLEHAGATNCTDVDGVRVPLSDTCTFQNYADQWDAMGGNGEFSAAHRVQLGWIPASQVVTLTTSSSVVVTPAYDPTSLVYRVADGKGGFVYIENRAYPKSPRDQNYDRSGPAGASRLLLRQSLDLIPPGSIGTQYTQLIEANPAVPPVNPTTAYPWPVGYVLTIPGTNTTIANVAWDGTNNIVSVTF